MGRLARHTPSLLTPILLLFAACGTLAKMDGCMHDNSDAKCLKSGPLLSTADPKEEQQSIKTRSLKSGQSSLPASVSFEELVESEQTPRNPTTYLITDDWLEAHKNDLNVAVREASEGDTIVFQVSPKTITLETTLEVNKSLTFITRPTPTTGQPTPVGIATYLQCPRKWVMMKIRASKVVFDGFVLTGCVKSRQDNMIMVFENNEVDFNNVYFYRNEAAVFLTRKGADLEIRNSIFMAIFSGRGRIFATTSGKVSATNTTFQDNASGSSNNALLTLYAGSEGKFKNCRFLRNKAKGHGGVFFANAKSTLDIEDCYFTRNQADHGSCVKAINSDVKITRCTFVNNEAKSDGGALNGWESSNFTVTQSNFTKNEGTNAGAFFLGTNSSAKLTECNFVSNYAKETGGAIRVQFNSSIAIHHCNFTANTCRGHGAVIHSLTNSTVNVSDSVFYKNKARFLAGAIGSYSGSQLKVENSDFLGNRAFHGGAIRLEINTFGNFSVCNFINNSAEGAGGAINLYLFATAYLSNCSIQNNVGRDGAAISLTDKNNATIVSAIISGNNAERYGGAIYLKENDKLNVVNTTLSGNYAEFGGAVYLSYNNTLTIMNATLSRNHVRHEGGAISLNSSNALNLVYTTLSGDFCHRTTRFNCTFTRKT